VYVLEFKNSLKLKITLLKLKTNADKDNLKSVKYYSESGPSDTHGSIDFKYFPF